MAAHRRYICHTCNAESKAVLENTSLLICRKCHRVVFPAITDREQRVFEMPPDWSFVQLGTTGEYNKQPFTVVGRARLQLRNDYKNFWCCEQLNGKSFWIMESFASFTILNSTWRLSKIDAHNLRAGNVVKIDKDLKVKGEYVEKCEAITFEGELGDWKHTYSGFFFIQASNAENKTAVFTINNTIVEHLQGDKIAVEWLNLKSTITWDEWK